MTAHPSSRNGDGSLSALGHLRVLELPGPAGQPCGKLMADMGADVIKVEPPGGDPARFVGPFAKDNPHPEGSLYFINFNTNKRSMVIDLTSQEGQRLFHSLASTADVVIESFAPGYLDSLGLGYRSLSRINPGLVMTSITPFGQTGPYKSYLGTDLIAQAMSGLMFIQGDDTKPPCMTPQEQAYQLTSKHALYSTLAAINYRRRSGRGQHVDMSLQEVMSHVLYTLVRYAFNSEIQRRVGRLSGAGGVSGYYSCKDGRDIAISVIFAHQFKTFVQWMGDETFLDPIWQDINFRRANQDVISEAVKEFIGSFTREEFVREAQSHRLPAIPINNMADVVNNPQMIAREYFVKSTHPYIGNHRYPGAPYRFGETPWTVRRPAPLLGQHQEEILEELKAPRAKRAKAGDGKRAIKGDLPLDGVRILDFTKVWAGPFGTRYLAQLGAEVIRVESNRFPDGGRAGGSSAAIGGPTFPDINHSKMSITLDFHTPEGNDLVKRLVKISDIVIDNFPTGTLERRGLGYEVLKGINPRIIMVSMPGYGTTGPYTNYVAFGQELMASSGIAYYWGHADSPQTSRSKVYYSDFASAAFNACAMMIALECRNETGKGQYIELAQSEAATSTMGVGLMDYLVNGRNWEPMGNRNFTAAPHGAYPCRGEDQWCVIACWSEEHWQKLCKTVGKQPWTTDSHFVTQESRWKHQDELDTAIGQWTKDYTPYQVMHMLQKSGVPAAAVQSGEQVYHDIQLRARDFIVEIEHCPPFGEIEHTGVNARLSLTPGRVKGLPGLGQENYYVFCDLLGLSRDEVDRLTEKKVLYLNSSQNACLPSTSPTMSRLAMKSELRASGCLRSWFDRLTMSDEFWIGSRTFPNTPSS
ncbi:MAG: CoA transferase [Chloroflexi bacterium]|nr:CoA transferase [Chloroflexota bacterium]